MGLIEESPRDAFRASVAMVFWEVWAAGQSRKYQKNVFLRQN